MGKEININFPGFSWRCVSSWCVPASLSCLNVFWPILLWCQRFTGTHTGEVYYYYYYYILVIIAAHRFFCLFVCLIQWIKSITWHHQLHLQTTCTIPSKPWKPTLLALLTCLVSTCIYWMNILFTLLILNVLHRIVLCFRSQTSEMSINVDLLFYWMRVKPVWPVSSPWRKLCDVFYTTHDPKHSDATWQEQPGNSDAMRSILIML